MKRRARRSRVLLRCARVVRLALVAWLVGACGEDVEGPRGDESYLPHADGFSWMYRVERQTGTPGTLLAVFDGAETVGGVQVQRMRITSDLGSGHGLARITASNFLVYSISFFGSTAVLNPPLEALSMPFELGDRFDNTSRTTLLFLPVDVRMTTRVEGFGPTTAGGRTYQDCFRFRTTVSLSAANIGFEVPATIWVAPGTGAVSAEIDVPPNPFAPVSGRISAELLDAGP